MAVLLYQLFIIGTLLLTRMLAPQRLQAASFIWTALTVINLFWPPLIALQLLVIWITFALIKPAEPVPGKLSPPSRSPAAENGVPPGRDDNRPLDPGPLARAGNILNDLGDYVTLQQAVQTATSSVLNACDTERFYIETAMAEADRQLVLEQTRSKDNGFNTLYEQNHARIGEMLRQGALRKGKDEKSPVRTVCADFSFPPPTGDEKNDQAIQRELTAAAQAYSALLESVVTRLQKPGLRKVFEEKMRGWHCEDILARIQCFEAGSEWRYAADIEKGRLALEQPPSQAAPRPDFKFVFRAAPVVNGRAATIPPDALSDQKRRREIEAASTALHIPLLAHFTRARNLASIMERGLCSVAKAWDTGIEPHVNDVLRLDGRPEAISLSIAFPNYKMFYSYRQTSPADDWVVLLIDPAVLWEKNCGFCQRNAADHRIRDLPLPDIMNAGAFRGMFDTVEGVATRQEQRLMQFDPTDPQAEVLVFQTIEPGFIKGIAFDDHHVQAACAPFLGDRQWKVFERDTGPFGSRGYRRA